MQEQVKPKKPCKKKRLTGKEQFWFDDTLLYEIKPE